MIVHLKEGEQICPFCGGARIYPPSMESTVICPYCEGTGKIKILKKKPKGK